MFYLPAWNLIVIELFLKDTLPALFEWHRRFREGEEDKPRSGRYQAMAQSRLAQTEESASVKVSNQSDADCIL